MGGSGGGTSGRIGAGGGVDGATVAATASVCNIGGLVVVWRVVLRGGWIGWVARRHDTSTGNDIDDYGAEISTGGFINIGLSAEINTLTAGSSAGSALDEGDVASSHRAISAARIASRGVSTCSRRAGGSFGEIVAPAVISKRTSSVSTG